MSKSKFAALTAGLLARKGEAIPSAHSAFMQASAWSQMTQPHPQHKEPAPVPGDLSTLIERAPRAALAAIAVQPLPHAERHHDEPVASADPAPEPPQLPLKPVRATAVPAAPSFGLRGRNAPIRRVAPSAAPSATPSGTAPVPRTVVTVRLDEARYLRLKLTSTRYGRTYQDILTRALDAYLTAVGIEPAQQDEISRWRNRLSRLISS